MNNNNNIGYYFTSPDCRKGSTFNFNINYTPQQKVDAETELQEEWKILVLRVRFSLPPADQC